MRKLATELTSLAVFRSLLSDPVLRALSAFLETPSVDSYAGFVSTLYETDKRTLAGYIQHIVNNDENAYIRMIGRGLTPWPDMEENVWQELAILQKAADLTPAALREALDSGKISGAGVDVLSTEPPPPDHPLLHHPRCRITPHTAWATVEARMRLFNTARENLRSFIAGGNLNRLV